MTPWTYELYIPRLMKAFFIIILLFSICMPIALLFMNHGGPPLVIKILFPIVLAFVWYKVLALPHRIIVHPDNKIEFVGILKRQTVLISQILSVHADHSQTGVLALRHSGGTIRIMSQFTGFHKLLSELEAANPGIEFLGC